MVLKNFMINGNSYTTSSVAKKDNQFVVTFIKNNSENKTIIASLLAWDHLTKTLTFLVDAKPYKIRVYQTSEQDVIGSYYFYNTKELRQVVGITKNESLCHSKGAQSLNIMSPLAGKITSVFVCEGQFVAAGQVLLAIESMKMENEICAPWAAHIKTLFIAQGDMVQPNQQLIVFEQRGE